MRYGCPGTGNKGLFYGTLEHGRVQAEMITDNGNESLQIEALYFGNGLSLMVLVCLFEYRSDKRTTSQDPFIAGETLF